MKRLLIALIALSIVLTTAGCSGNEKEKSSVSEPSKLSGEVLFKERCSCHYSYYENPSGNPEWLRIWEEQYYGSNSEKWKSGIEIMVKSRFTSVSEEEKEVIAEYLAERFGEQ